MRLMDILAILDNLQDHYQVGGLSALVMILSILGNRKERGEDVFNLLMIWSLFRSSISSGSKINTMGLKFLQLG